MTVSAIIECTTCGNKVRMRNQVGKVNPVIIKVACNECGKLLKGQYDAGKFIFPTEIVHLEYEHTTQTASISTELPIVLATANDTSMVVFTPFMALTDYLDFEDIMEFMSGVNPFLLVYDKKFGQLTTVSEIFINGNWKYFLAEAKKNFLPAIATNVHTFEECAPVINSLFNDFYVFIRSDYYDDHFSKTLMSGTLDKVTANIADLKRLKTSLETYINLEAEYKKGVQLMVRFLENVKSFLPAIAMTFTDDFTREYKDEIGITTFEFADLKDLYIEQFEFLSRISALYFGLWNLAERGDYDNFGTIRDCNMLSQYYGKDNGIKKDIIKKSPLLNDYFLNTLDSQVRNGIGHLKTVYDNRQQLIRYYPYKDPAKIANFKEMYLIDFAIQVYQQALKVKDAMDILSGFITLAK